MRNSYLLLSLVFILPFNLSAKNITGVSGDVIAVIHTQNTSAEDLIIKHEQSEYLILGLPYVYQTKFKKIGSIDIEVQHKNFGESRITIKDVSKKAAKANCVSTEQTYGSCFYTYTYSSECELI